jgi:sugar lactone lactonase YvrE
MKFSHIACFLVGGFALALGLPAQTQYATPYAFTTLAGASSVGFRDGPGNTAQFFGPGSLVTDASGNVFVADEGNHLIRRITPAGVVSTFAGLAGVAGTTDGTGSAARFDGPHGLAIDAGGNLYVADTGNHAIRKITPAGVVSTIAGLGGVAGSIDGSGSAARFNQPFGIAVNSAGDIYVTDSGNSAIRRITAAGIVTTIAPARFIPTVGGTPSNNYGAIAADPAGNIVVSRFDTLRWNPDEPLNQNFSTEYIGYVTRYAPDGTATDLQQTKVSFGPGNVQTGSYVTGLAFNAASELITRDREFTIDRMGNFYYSDFPNNTVLKGTATGEPTLLAGIPESTTRLTVDGSASAARFVRPSAVTVDPAGNAYVADQESHCIRKITPDGTVTTLAGAAGQTGITDGPGPAARFNTPRGITLGPNGMLYVADFGNHAIRRVSPSGETQTIAGQIGELGYEDGVGTAARFFLPRSIAADGTGNLYVGTSGSATTLRRIAPDGTVTTLMLGGGWYSRPSRSDRNNQEFDFLGSVATDHAGNIYVADIRPGDMSIHKVTPAGVMSTLVDRSSAMAQPLAMSVDPTGNIFAVDAAKHTVVKITPTGIASIAGLADSPGSADGLGVQARFFLPQGIVVNSAGVLYVTSGTTVRKGQTGLAATITSQPQSISVAAGGLAQFSVAAGGNPAPTFQWHFNGNALAGATGSSFSITGVQATNAGAYTVTVTNSLGSVTSNPATLAVTSGPVSPPPPGGGSSGGGGAPSIWFLLALLTAGAIRAARPRRE